MNGIYAILIFSATLIGGITGLGGGVILKPTLDATHSLSFIDVSVLSSIAVCTMSMVQTVQAFKSPMKIDTKLMILMVVGIILGSNLGVRVLGYLGTLIEEGSLLKLQAGMLIVVIVLILIADFRNLQLKTHFNSISQGIIGIIMGALSALLGIGGGPINVIVFRRFFKLSFTESATYSLICIFFSQLMLVIGYGASGDINVSNSRLIPLFMGVAIWGSLATQVVSKKLPKNFDQKLYNIVVIALLLINVYNFISY